MSEKREYLLPVYTKRMSVKDAEAVFPHDRSKYEEYRVAFLREMFEMTSVVTEFTSTPDGPDTMTGLRIIEKNGTGAL